MKKKYLENKFKGTEGITLIALVVTIIILLIITGVTVSTLTSENGLIAKTIEAKKKMDEARKIEDLQFKFWESEMLEPWDGTVATKFPNQDEPNAGEESNPYKITNGAELAYLAKCVNEGNSFENKYITIENSINLGNHEFEPIGKGEIGFFTEAQIRECNIFNNEFNGFLNGKNNVIIGLTINQEEMNGVGLIGVLGESGKVENVNVLDGSIIGRNCVGGIIGVSKGIINNCINKVNVLAQDTEDGYSSGQMVGGIVGIINKGSISNCTNNGNIIGKDECMKVSRGKFVGGIVGYLYTAENITITIENCTNNGNVTTQYQQAGGILGGTEESSENSKVKIENCNNTGEIIAKAKQDDLTGTGLNERIIGTCGGIVGWITTGADIKKCSNSGKISVAGNAAGGIAGELKLVSGTISECTNSGKITATKQQAGGIVGLQKSGTISECTNSGEVCTLSNNLAGGIVGWMNGGEKIEKCSNSGKVTAAYQQAGGIVGQQFSGTISECTNSGEVCTLSNNLAGGIVGWMNGGEKIEKCSNVGNVTVARQQVGGIVGKQESGTISECTNSGEISAPTNSLAGGIVGWIHGGEKIEKCTNSGKVTASVQMAGGIASRHDSGTISECSNSGEISTLSSNYAGGIIGAMAGGEKIEKCSNSGKVTAADQQAGGITGFQSSGTISECTNSGYIYSKGAPSSTYGGIAGGIVGLMNNSNAKVTKVYNQGTVKCDNIPGDDRIGGIVGSISSGNEVSYAYNKGALIGGDTFGMIVGRNNASNIVSKCYYYFTDESNIPGIGGTTATTEGNYLTGTTRSNTDYASLDDFLNGEGKEN